MGNERGKKMSKKKIISIVLPVGILLLFLGIVFHIVDLTKYKENSKSKNKSENLTQEQIDNIYQKQRNTAKDIGKKHCLADLCIKKMTITYEYNAYGTISATLFSTSEKTIPEGFLNLVFELENKTETMGLFHQEIKPNQEVPIEVQFSNANIIKATTYEMKLPTKEELAKYEMSKID